MAPALEPPRSASSPSPLSSRPTHRSHTLRVVDLLSTRVQSVRIELVGPESGTLSRLGTVLVYLPVLLVGYLLMLAALMKLIASAVGWGLTFFVFGAVHLAVSAWGISRGRGAGVARTYDVVDPQLESAQDPAADKLPDLSRRSPTSGGMAAVVPRGEPGRATPLPTPAAAAPRQSVVNPPASGAAAAAVRPRADSTTTTTNVRPSAGRPPAT